MFALNRLFENTRFTGRLFRRNSLWADHARARQYRRRRHDDDDINRDFARDGTRRCRPQTNRSATLPSFVRYVRTLSSARAVRRPYRPYSPSATSLPAVYRAFKCTTPAGTLVCRAIHLRGYGPTKRAKARLPNGTLTRTLRVDRHVRTSFA